MKASKAIEKAKIPVTAKNSARLQAISRAFGRYRIGDYRIVASIEDDRFVVLFLRSVFGGKFTDNR